MLGGRQRKMASIRPQTPSYEFGSRSEFARGGGLADPPVRIQIQIQIYTEGNLLGYLGFPPSKNLKVNCISKIPKNLPKPYEIRVPNSDWTRVDFSGKFAKYPGPPPLQKCKKAIS